MEAFYALKCKGGLHAAPCRTSMSALTDWEGDTVMDPGELTLATSSAVVPASSACWHVPSFALRQGVGMQWGGVR